VANTFRSTTLTGTDSSPNWTAPEVVAAAVYQGVNLPLPTCSNSRFHASLTVVTGVRLKTTGRIAKKDTATGTSYTDYKDWYINGTPGTFYCMFEMLVQNGGTLAVTGSSLGAWLALSSDQTVTLSQVTGGVSDATVKYFISTTISADGIVDSGEILLDSEGA
jgi:hypothetical protein